jgi:hypothetical protein
MPLSFSIIREGLQFYLTGKLHKNSFGGGKQSKYWENYPVRIVRIIDDGRDCPILLGDDYSDELGWVSYDELTMEYNEIRASLTVW